MSDWNPEQYLLFQKERNQPIHDLINRIEVKNPHRILDIGCGPGNSTAALRDHWKEAEITGIDFSETMIKKARKDHPELQFMIGDAGKDLSHLGEFDLVFANASLQWIPDHENLIPRLFGMVRPNGAFATQIPQFKQMPIAKTIIRMTETEKWSHYFKNFQDEHFFYADNSYYDYLNQKSSDIVIWASKYYHIMENHHKIIEMIQSTGLKPYLDYLPDELHLDFLNDVLEGIKADYPLQSDQKVLFPFDRLFIIAYNGSYAQTQYPDELVTEVCYPVKKNK